MFDNRWKKTEQFPTGLLFSPHNLNICGIFVTFVPEACIISDRYATAVTRPIFSIALYLTSDFILFLVIT